MLFPVIVGISPVAVADLSITEFMADNRSLLQDADTDGNGIADMIAYVLGNSL